MPAKDLRETETTDEGTIMTYYDPNYKRRCCVCGSKPCVRIRRENDSVFYDGEMCGPCTWGEAETIDPSTW